MVTVPTCRWSPFPRSLSYRTTHSPPTTYASRYLNACADRGTGCGTRHIVTSAKASGARTTRRCISAVARMLKTMPTDGRRCQCLQHFHWPTPVLRCADRMHRGRFLVAARAASQNSCPHPHPHPHPHPRVMREKGFLLPLRSRVVPPSASARHGYGRTPALTLVRRCARFVARAHTRRLQRSCSAILLLQQDIRVHLSGGYVRIEHSCAAARHVEYEDGLLARLMIAEQSLGRLSD